MYCEKKYTWVISGLIFLWETPRDEGESDDPGFGGRAFSLLACYLSDKCSIFFLVSSKGPQRGSAGTPLLGLPLAGKLQSNGQQDLFGHGANFQSTH